MNNSPAPMNDIDKLLNEFDFKIPDSLIPSKKDALLHHRRFVKAAALGDTANMVMRREALEMYTTNGFLELEVPYENDPTQKMMFGDFKSWLYFAADEAQLPDSSTSALKSLMEFVVDPVQKGLLVNPTTGKPYKTIDVLSLKEGKAQTLASAARNVLNNADKSDEEKKSQLSTYLAAALNVTITRGELSEMFRDDGTSHLRGGKLSVDVAYVGDKTIYMIVASNENEEIRAQLAFRGRADLHSMSIDDLSDKINDLRIVDRSQNDDNARVNTDDLSDEDYNEWLMSKTEN